MTRYFIAKKTLTLFVQLLKYVTTGRFLGKVRPYTFYWGLGRLSSWSVQIYDSIYALTYL